MGSEGGPDANATAKTAMQIPPATDRWRNELRGPPRNRTISFLAAQNTGRKAALHVQFRTMKDLSTRSLLWAFLAVAVASYTTGAPAPQPEGSSPEVLEIGSRVELFVDRHLIDVMDDVELELGQPQPREKVFRFDQPWEGNTPAHIAIFRDGDVYRMYYRGSANNDYIIREELLPGEKIVPQHPKVSCYAESRDGIRWTRPNSGPGGVSGVPGQQHSGPGGRHQVQSLPRREPRSSRIGPLQGGRLLPDRPRRPAPLKAERLGPPPVPRRRSLDLDGAGTGHHRRVFRFPQRGLLGRRPGPLRGAVPGLRPRGAHAQIRHLEGLRSNGPRAGGSTTETPLRNISTPTRRSRIFARPTSTWPFPSGSCRGEPRSITTTRAPPSGRGSPRGSS